MTDHLIAQGATWAELAPLLRRVLDSADDAVVVQTSGSSGEPKRVRLPGPALRASGEATARLVGHGRWVLALPTHHVAGLQVLARSVLAGTSPVPVALDPGMPFRPAPFAAAVAEAHAGQGTRTDHARPVLTSLVPTQLARLLDDPVGVAALQRVTVLLGGAAADPGLLAGARAAGARVHTTYGMSETCGGCVYDGVPLPGVRVRIDPADERVHLGGPVVAGGYLDRPGLTAERFLVDAEGTRWFVTDDRGRWDEAEGRLTVLGRLDDVIVTGGHKVEPRDVEAALRRLPQVRDALVVGLPDPEWGQRVAALLVADSARTPTTLNELRIALSPTLPPHALPRQVAWRDAIPQLGPGKPDRATAREDLAAGAPQEAVAE
ncbi:AMP-binding protein [Ornithinimicrobium tianjinense]|uniref:O-succinylbenzoic acid--CoA ligase n=1 Tax=Ornithinimicrobium tianjinense TaxID=1195761 RepID=A0A917BEF5_9MICO|nr:AMP-binding protein [Ornithinimicrobium tianjinense]GGF38074.1 O-succinylbenzoic acid--CoA ligase [Ornithinimicrobium tianjinense]